MEAGQLENTAVAELCHRLSDHHATGCLRIRHDATEAFIWFRDGHIYTATAPEARPRLGDRLVGAGHINEEQLADTLRLQRSLPAPRRIGELLVQRGLVEYSTLQSYVREQIADSVAVTLGWTEGKWAFIPGEEVPEDAPLEMSVDNLLMEGVRRLEEWEVIRARLGSLDTIVDFPAAQTEAELSLTPDEWSMLTQIDGASSVAEIAEASGYGQFETARIIYGLLTAGVVTIHEPPAHEPPAHEPPAEQDRPEADPGAAPRDDFGFYGDLAASGRAQGADTAAAGTSGAKDEAALPPRNELLREFAALRDEPATEEPTDEPSSEESRPAAPPPRQEPEEREPPKRGFFGSLFRRR